MFRGIDISHWDGDISIDENIDFIIVKATEGVNYIDNTFASNVKKVRRLGKLLGAYHFAALENPAYEAQFFFNTIKDCMPLVPVLDYETERSGMVEWCEKFIDRFYQLSGIYPTLYISAYLCNDFSGSWIPDFCPLWVAGYPTPEYSDWISRECPYNVGPWGKPDIWQFTSVLDYNGNKVDANIAYMTEIGFLALMGLEMNVNELINELLGTKVHTSYGDFTIREILAWIYAYTRDMQPVVFDTQKRVAALEKRIEK